TKPPEINAKSLRKFPEFAEFVNLSSQGNRNDGEETKADQTPQEVLEASYQNLRRELAQELLLQIKKCPPRFFEKLVVDVLVAMGYGGSRKDAGQAVGQSGDGGIDGIIKEDKLGLDVVYVQAKRWEAPVGSPVVQAFSGSLDGQRSRKGVLITTSRFSPQAAEYVNRIEKRIVLIDGEQLAQLMIDHGIGVTEISTYAVKKMDLGYFGDE
ncbi:MAG: restriction endonuclease, partial [Dehalococcoidia bacterium]|nr:restriction endonuclease [Dehalococcoidia bacterium]